jgi:hypothetical protein
MRAHEELTKLAPSKMDILDPAKSDMEYLGACPPLPGMGRKRTKKNEHLNVVTMVSEFEVFKFVAPDGALLTDEAGRKTFSMLPSTAERLAASMGATAKRV